MKFQKKIGGYLITTFCSPTLAEQANSLFNKLSELNKTGPQLRDGTIIRFGWSDLKLVQQKDELALYEPDFSKNPKQDFLHQVTITLQVLKEQSKLLNEIGVTGLDCSYLEKVVTAKGCLNKPDIYLERSKQTEKNDSGWYIGETSDNGKEHTLDDFESHYIFEIFQIRPSIMRVLALPPGYLAVFKEDEIKAILNDKNKNLWTEK